MGDVGADCAGESLGQPRVQRGAGRPRSGPNRRSHRGRPWRQCPRRRCAARHAETDPWPVAASSSVLRSSSASGQGRPVRPSSPLSQVRMRLVSSGPQRVVGQLEHDTGIQIAAGRFARQSFDRRVAARDHDRPAAHGRPPVRGAVPGRCDRTRGRGSARVGARHPDRPLHGRCPGSRTGAAIAIPSSQDPAHTSARARADRQRTKFRRPAPRVSGGRHGAATSPARSGSARARVPEARATSRSSSTASVTNTGAGTARRRRVLACRSRRAAAGRHRGASHAPGRRPRRETASRCGRTGSRASADSTAGSSDSSRERGEGQTAECGFEGQDVHWAW